MASHTNTQAGPQKTPLANWHERNGAKMVDFAGWWMPVQYTGIREEHLAVRAGVGLFDVSHMGEFTVRGPQALETLQWLTTNDAAKLKAGEAQYSLFPNPEGGIVDDLFVYCVEPGRDYLLCVNAANIEKDERFLMQNNRGAEIRNVSNDWAQIAVQGPKADQVLRKALGRDLTGMPRSTHISLRVPGLEVQAGQGAKSAGAEVIVARTGYTGEQGVEIFVQPETVEGLWNLLLEVGQPEGARPIGLGARDTLRTEVKYSLYGHEIDDTTHPYEAALGWVVKPKAKDFLGREAMLKRKESDPPRRLVGLILEDKGIPRQGFAVLSGDGREKVGVVTSGTLSPSTGQAIGIAYVKQELSTVGQALCVDLRGRPARARVVETPFVRTSLNP